MKKKIALVLAGLMTMGLMGCGNAAQAPATESAPAQTETKAEEKDIYNPGRADVLTLLVIDHEKNTYALLPIDRDTITARRILIIG